MPILNHALYWKRNLWFLLIKQVKQYHVHWDEWLSLLQLSHESHWAVSFMSPRCTCWHPLGNRNQTWWSNRKHLDLITYQQSSKVSKNTSETHTVVSRTVVPNHIPGGLPTLHVFHVTLIKHTWFRSSARLSVSLFIYLSVSPFILLSTVFLSMSEYEFL